MSSVVLRGIAAHIEKCRCGNWKCRGHLWTAFPPAAEEPTTWSRQFITFPFDILTQCRHPSRHPISTPSQIRWLAFRVVSVGLRNHPHSSFDSWNSSHWRLIRLFVSSPAEWLVAHPQNFGIPSRLAQH